MGEAAAAACVIDEEAAVRERLVLKSAALDRLVRRYVAFGAALSGGSAAEKELAALEAELDDFERAATLVGATEQSQQADIAAARAACGELEPRIQAAAAQLEALRAQLAQEQAAAPRRQEAARLAAEVAELPSVPDATARLDALQQELQQVQQQCAEMEQRLRAQQQQLEPLKAAALRFVELSGGSRL